MSDFGKIARSIVRFSLATFLWLHALFLVTPEPAAFSGVQRWLRLTPAEFILLGLLAIFSVLIGGGFWRSLGNVAYVYFFPFVVLYYAGCFLFHGLSQLGRAISGKPGREKSAVNLEQVGMPQSARSPESPSKPKKPPDSFADVITRPFRRFAFLWGLLLLFGTHIQVIWIALIVVLLHLGWGVVWLVRFTFFPGNLDAKIRSVLLTRLDRIAAKLTPVTEESAPTRELRNLWSQISGFKALAELLQGKPVVNKWLHILGAVALAAIYLYLSIFFSFAYYGIARVGGTSYTWTDALVTALFIPFYVADLPKLLWLKVLGGIHCCVILYLVFGALTKHLRRSVEPIHSALTLVNVRLEDEDLREKLRILRQKFEKDASSNIIE